MGLILPVKLPPSLMIAISLYVVHPERFSPKWIQGNTPDIRDDRITYNLPRLLKKPILKGHRRYYRLQKETPELFDWAQTSNFSNNRCSFNSAACKSFGIPKAVVHHGAQIKPVIQKIEDKQVYFADGSQVEADALLCCTGFKPSFPFLDESVTDRFGCISNLWKNMFDPHFNETLCFIGFARPHQINLLAVAEIQARTFAAIISGDRPIAVTGVDVSGGEGGSSIYEETLPRKSDRESCFGGLCLLHRNLSSFYWLVTFPGLKFGGKILNSL